MTHRPMCYTCFKPRVVCLCDRLTKVHNRTHIMILQHPEECRHPIGTAKIATLSLANVTRVVCPKKEPLPSNFQPGDALLFPSPGARDLAELTPDEAPKSLMVIDGTWSQAKFLYRINPFLAQVPHYRINPANPSRYRIRREPRLDYISTIESIVVALQALEPDTPNITALLDVFESMIDDQIEYQQKKPDFEANRDLKRLIRQKKNRSQHLKTED